MSRKVNKRSGYLCWRCFVPNEPGPTSYTGSAHTWMSWMHEQNHHLWNNAQLALKQHVAVKMNETHTNSLSNVLPKYYEIKQYPKTIFKLSNMVILLTIFHFFWTSFNFTAVEYSSGQFCSYFMFFTKTKIKNVTVELINTSF